MMHGTLPACGSGLGIDSAIKMFKDDPAADDAVNARQLFEKEVHALAANPHPNFVQLLGTSVDGTFFLLPCRWHALVSGLFTSWS